ncbi:MAG: potassium channel family protein [Dissulfuribacterales bacterium]
MKQFVIIGLGNFGFYLAISLYKKGHEVLAIDINPKPVQAIKDSVSQAVIADTTEKKILEHLGIQNMDAAIICIGSNMEASILTTLNIKDIGVKQIIAKAISEPHSRILYNIGATEIIFPEKDMAISLGERLNNPNILDYLPFLDDYSIIEWAPPNKFIGKTLQELDLINRYGTQVIAIKALVPEQIMMIPKAGFVIKDSDIIILLGPNDGINRLNEENK